MESRPTANHISAILNAAWMVRHYARGSRVKFQQEERQQAILVLGLAVREAFNTSDDYEALLTAVVDGLRPKDERAF